MNTRLYTIRWRMKQQQYGHHVELQLNSRPITKIIHADDFIVFMVNRWWLNLMPDDCDEGISQALSTSSSCPTPPILTKINKIWLFWLQIIFLPILWCFEQNSFFQILKKISPTPPNLTKINKMFDFFGCKSFFCPFYDVFLSKKVFFRFWKK